MIIRENESIEVLATLIKHKWIIIIFTLVLTIVSFFYALSMEVQYKSTANVVPPSNAADGLLGGALSGISSKLKDFGITKVGGGGGGGQSYELSVLMESRSVFDSMITKFELIKSYKVKNNSRELARDILSGNIEILNYKEGNIEFSIWDNDPKKAAEMTNEFINIVNDKAIEMNQKEAAANITYLEKRIEHTDEILLKLGDSLAVYSKKYQIYSPDDQASVYSEALSELTTTVMKMETEYEISKNKLGENDPYTVVLKDYVKQARTRLQDAKTKPGLIGNFSLNDVSKVGMEYMRLYTEYEAHSKMKIFLMPTLEKTKLDMVSNNNYLFVVDPAVPSEKKDRPKRSLIVIGTFAGAFILSILLVLLINIYNNTKSRLIAFKEISVQE